MAATFGAEQIEQAALFALGFPALWIDSGSEIQKVRDWLQQDPKVRPRTKNRTVTT